MKIWALFYRDDYDGEEDKRDATLDAWWVDKPNAIGLVRVLSTTFSQWESFGLYPFAKELLNGEEIYIYGCYFQLKQIEEGKI